MCQIYDCAQIKDLLQKIAEVKGDNSDSIVSSSEQDAIVYHLEHCIECQQETLEFISKLTASLSNLHALSQKIHPM